MNEKLIQAKVDIHRERMNQLSKIELELIDMISKTGDEKLMDKFLDWQNQRTLCNLAYAATLKVMAE
jgi:hypothetical protein